MPRCELSQEMRRRRRRDLLWQRRKNKERGDDKQEGGGGREGHHQHHRRCDVQQGPVEEEVVTTYSGSGNVKVEVATTTTTTGDGGENDQEDYFGVGGFSPVGLELAERGNEQEECLICGKLETRDLNRRRGINFIAGVTRRGGTTSSECDQLKSQLWAMFVLRRVLGFPEEECSRLLQLSFGLNPNDWFDLCGECSGVVEAVLEMQEQVRVLEGKMKGLRIGLKSKLEGNLRVEKKKKGSSKDSADLEEVGVLQIRDEIRKYFKGILTTIEVKANGQLVFPKSHRVRPPRRPKRTRGHSTTRGGGHVGENDHDDDGFSGSNDSDRNDNPENDPSWTDDEGEGEYGGRGGGVSRSPSPDDEGACKSKDRGKKGHYSCSICSLPYSNSIRLGYHMRKYHRNGEPAAVPSIQCAHCPAKLLNLYAVNLHNRKEHPELYKVRCELCDFVGKSSGQLRQHRKSKHREKDNNRCPYCGRSYAYPSIINHKKICPKRGEDEINKKKNECQEGGDEEEEEESNADLAPSSSSPPDQFNCDKCGYLTTSKYRWQSHLKTHDYDDHMDLINAGAAFQCRACSAVFTSKLQIHRHLRDAHHAELGLALHQCPTCGKMFGRGKTLAAHLRKVHSEDRKAWPDPSEFRQLELADPPKATIITPTTQLSEDDANAPGREPNGSSGLSNICDICGLSYASRYRLDVHRRTFHKLYVTKPRGGGGGGGRPGGQARASVKCDYCESTFINIYAMRLHFRASHPEVFKFKCDLCDDYAGRTADNVFQHKRLKHAAVKRVKCPYCSNDYHLNSLHKHTPKCASRLGIQMEARKKYRKGGGRVLCKVCDARFKTAEAANLHNRAEHGDVYSHFCDECDYVAKSTANVARHKRYVHEGAVGECPYCQAEIPFTQFYHHKRKCREQLGLIKMEDGNDDDGEWG